MLMVLSPAKKLDYDSTVRTTLYSEPVFTEKTKELVKIMQTKSAQDIAKLMSLSDSLAELNAARYADWHNKPDLSHARQAILAFNGDVYEGLQAADLSDDALQWADKHLAILSGLYGVLGPLDLMQPYRLEMGTKLKNPKGSNLYQFWGDDIALELNRRLSLLDASEKNQSDLPILLNLASVEYFKSVSIKSLKARVLECVFQDEKSGTWKIISFYAKKARGLMARFVIDNKITNIKDLCDFDTDGYSFAADVSTTNKLIFRRKQQ